MILYKNENMENKNTKKYYNNTTFSYDSATYFFVDIFN